MGGASEKHRIIIRNLPSHARALLARRISIVIIIILIIFIIIYGLPPLPPTHRGMV